MSRFRKRRVPKGDAARRIRTTQRLRRVGATKTPLTDATPEEVRERIEQMRYGSGSNDRVN